MASPSDLPLHASSEVSPPVTDVDLDDSLSEDSFENIDMLVEEEEKGDGAQPRRRSTAPSKEKEAVEKKEPVEEKGAKEEEAEKKEEAKKEKKKVKRQQEKDVNDKALSTVLLLAFSITMFVICAHAFNSNAPAKTAPPAETAPSTKPSSHNLPADDLVIRRRDSSEEIKKRPIALEKFHPTTPALLPLENFDIGNRIRVVGTPHSKAVRFHIDFLVGEDIAVHFNPRFEENIVVRNHGFWKNADWEWNFDLEERTANSPFKRSEGFVVEFHNIGDHVSMTVNGKYFGKFTERNLPIFKSTRLSIGGDVTIHSVQQFNDNH